MKPLSCVTESVRTHSFQEELVAAIHGAFEVAVEIAVREVKKLLAGQASNDRYEELRRENETLKERLQRAEAQLEENRGSPPPTNHLSSCTRRTDHPPHPHCDQKSQNPNLGSGHSCAAAGKGSDRQDEHVRREEEQSSAEGVEARYVRDAAAAQKTKQNKGFSKEVSPEGSCVYVVKTEKAKVVNQNKRPLEGSSPSRSSTVSEATLQDVAVKQEVSEEERNGPSCCLDAIKVEDFSLDCMSETQSEMLEEWNSEVPDGPSQDSDTLLSSGGLDQVHPVNPESSLPPPTDLQSLSSEFPNVFQAAELSRISETPPQLYGVHVRTSHKLTHSTATLYACKACGQTFHLPSLLRRHHSQCPLRLPQRYQQPVTGSKRTRLQLYPPGCSPFRCTVCSREFNRMENLKTHLRIHTGERPYTCTVCAKCFRHSGALTRHFRIHTGEKPYVCGQCGKSFRNCGGLKFHQRSHSKQLQ